MPPLERTFIDSVICRGDFMPPTLSKMPSPDQASEDFGAALPGAPPPLCPMLVMHSEAWLSISMQHLTRGPGSFEIVGWSGAALLRAEVLRMECGGREVRLALTQEASPTLASVAVSRGSAALRGVGGQSYGELRPAAAGAHGLFIGEREVLGVSPSPWWGWSGRRILFAPGSASELATASRRWDSDRGVEQLEVWVNPGVDAVLVLCCLLGELLLGEPPVAQAGAEPDGARPRGTLTPDTL